MVTQLQPLSRVPMVNIRSSVRQNSNANDLQMPRLERGRYRGSSNQKACFGSIRRYEILGLDMIAEATRNSISDLAVIASCWRHHSQDSVYQLIPVTIVGHGRQLLGGLKRLSRMLDQFAAS